MATVLLICQLKTSWRLRTRASSFSEVTGQTCSSLDHPIGTSTCARCYHMHSYAIICYHAFNCLQMPSIAFNCLYTHSYPTKRFAAWKPNATFPSTQNTFHRATFATKTVMILMMFRIFPDLPEISLFGFCSGPAPCLTLMGAWRTRAHSSTWKFTRCERL